MTLVFKRLAVLALCLLTVSLSARDSLAQTLHIYSATDTPAMQPLLDRFEAQNPGVELHYSEFQTLALYDTLLRTSPSDMPDVVISSAMDLQVDLVNRGIAQRLAVIPDAAPPDWARWRSELFGFTFEPAVMVYDRRAIDKDDLPSTHRELATFVRRNETRLHGRIGGYDLRESGIGYLYATQDSVQGPQAPRLIETLGRAGLKTHCCTSEMVAATASGELAFAINAIGSYASELAEDTPHLGLHFFDDYNLVMSRTAFVPKGAANVDLAARFIGFLLSPEGQRTVLEETPLLPLIPAEDPTTSIERLIQDRRGTFLPIRLTPGLLTFLDDLKKQEFLSAWDASLGRGP